MNRLKDKRALSPARRRSRRPFAKLWEDSRSCSSMPASPTCAQWTNGTRPASTAPLRSICRVCEQRQQCLDQEKRPFSLGRTASGRTSERGESARHYRRISALAGRRPGLKLGRAARKQLLHLIAGASPLNGDFFRSLAFQYFHPDDVISGEGTRLHGGRFVPVGVRAVYASLEESRSEKLH